MLRLCLFYVYHVTLRVVHAEYSRFLGMSPSPREDVVHGLARGLKRLELEGRVMGLKILFSTLREGEGARRMNTARASV